MEAGYKPRALALGYLTMDVAKRLDGEWLIVELGDGQVAGLPEQADVGAFYSALAERLSS